MTVAEQNLAPHFSLTHFGRRTVSGETMPAEVSRRTKTPALSLPVFLATFFAAFFAASLSATRPGRRRVVAAALAVMILCLANSILGSAQALEGDLLQQFILHHPGDLGGRVAFTADVEGKEKILLLDLDARRIRILIDAPGNNFSPSWSPDGRRLVFVSDRDGTKQIYVADWTGEKVTQVTKDGRTNDYPSWSPDGNKIVYNSAKSDTDDSNFFVSSPDGSATVQLTAFKGRNTVGRFSPSGHAITYTTNRFWPGWDICSFVLKAKEEECILTGVESYCRASWSPSGKQLAYSFGMLDQLDIATLDTTNQKREVLTSGPGSKYDAVWDPAETQILYSSDQVKKGTFNLYLVDLKKQSRLLVESTYSLRFPTWTKMQTITLEAERIRAVEAELSKVQAKLTPAGVTPTEVPASPISTVSAPAVITTATSTGNTKALPEASPVPRSDPSLRSSPSEDGRAPE